jgi:DNA-binding response OmpR family regulator
MAKTPKILIVDDDAEVLIALERVLESEGYRTATAWSGREALSLSEKTNFDLLLVAEHLSDFEMNAFLPELTRKQPKAVRLVMSTGKDQPSSPREAQPAVCKWEHGEMKARIRNTFQRSA